MRIGDELAVEADDNGRVSVSRSDQRRLARAAAARSTGPRAPCQASGRLVRSTSCATSGRSRGLSSSRSFVSRH